jgi:hypothetical protein
VEVSNPMNLGGKSKFPILTSPEVDQERLLFYLEKQLKYEGATQVVRRGDLVIFSGRPVAFVRMRSFLYNPGRGFLRVTMEDQHLAVTYRMSFMWIIAFVIIGILFFTWHFIFNNLPLEPYLFFVVGGSLSFGFNIFTMLVSLAMFIERTFDSFMRE